jgi:hypothetical protein|tara:strand:- start:1748 stop:1951 length:204 start_codon:yes stop_codon:yes gene_type:complete
MTRFLLTILLLMTAAFVLGRTAYKKELDSCMLEVADLKQGYQLLEENLLYCWSELPSTHIREGSIDN